MVNHRQPERMLGHPPMFRVPERDDTGDIELDPAERVGNKCI